MSQRNSKGPDRAMGQPKAYKSSIDPMKVQSTLNMDTRQKHYRSSKPINFNNKIAEYQPNNDYYKQSFWDAPKRKLVQQPQKKKETPKPPQPRPEPKRRPPPAPKPQPAKSTLKPLPQANFNFKRAPVEAEPPKQSYSLPQSQESSEIPVRHFQETEPEVWSSPPPSNEMEQWGEPTKVIPDLNPKPAPVQKQPDFSNMPGSTVGSMSRMIAMFT